MIDNKQQRPRVLLVHRAVIFNKNGEVLLIKRSESDNYNPGLWEFPGGKLDERQDLRDALDREVAEETGLTVEIKTPIAYVGSKIVSDGGPYDGLPYVVIIGTAKLTSGDVRLSEEHAYYKWINPSDIPVNLTLTSEVRTALSVIDRL